jgi:restriction system protein
LYQPEAPSGMGKLFGGGRHKRELEEAKASFDRDLTSYNVEEEARKQRLAFEENRFQQTQMERNDEIRAHNAEIDTFMTGLAAGDPSAICQYFEIVLEKSVYPLEFPQHFKIAYVPESKHLVCEYDLPGIGVVPSQKAHKYVKSRDEISATPRSIKETRALYASVLAQIPLRTVHEILESDRQGFIETVTFNGVLESINPSTGRMNRSCVVSFRTSRSQFEELDLAQVDPISCLRNLNASVSKSPDELVAVKPVVEFNMVDQRFVNETDVLSELDERPNLLDLTPTEFESLIQNLFAKMGLDTKQTRASRDGGGGLRRLRFETHLRREGRNTGQALQEHR